MFFYMNHVEWEVAFLAKTMLHFKPLHFHFVGIQRFTLLFLLWRPPKPSSSFSWVVVSAVAMPTLALPRESICLTKVSSILFSIIVS